MILVACKVDKRIDKIKAGVSEKQRLCFESAVKMWGVFANEWGRLEGLKADGGFMQSMLGCMGLRDATEMFDEMLKNAYLSLADEPQD